MEFNIENWYQENLLQESKENGSLRYHLTSFVLHVVSFSAAILIGSMMPAPVIPLVTEFTILDSVPGAGSASATLVATSPNPVPEMKASAQKEIAPVATAPKKVKWDQDTVVIEKPKAKRMAKAAPKMKQVVAHKAISKPAHKAFHGPTVRESDLEAPILETEEFETSLKQELHYKAQKFDDRSIQDEIRKIDREQEVKVAALQNELDQETNQFISEQNDDLNALEADKNATNRILKANTDKMKASESAKVAAAKSAEKAAADRAAAEAYAAKRAAEARAGALAAAKAAEEKSVANSRGGKGRGEGGAGALDGRSYGVNGPVRSLEDIRQMPGNKRPQYDSEDRFNRRQGEVAFLAFVSGDGKITEVKLIKATGHRSLDAKTLQAIRDWKFYPGQEGWVEIPFRWDLKGGPQEMPTTLRRKITQM